MSNFQNSKNATAMTEQTVNCDFSFWRDKSVIRNESAFYAKDFDVPLPVFDGETFSSMVRTGEATSIRGIKKCLVSWTSAVIEHEYKIVDGEIGTIAMWKERLDAMFEFFNFLDCAVVAAVRRTDFHVLASLMLKSCNSDKIDYVKDFARNGFLLLCNSFEDRCDSYMIYEHSFYFQVLNSFLEMLLARFQDLEAINAKAKAMLSSHI